MFSIANSDTGFFMLVTPNDNDSPEHQILWGKNNQEIDDLIKLEFMIEVSGNFQTEIEKFFKDHGHVYRVFQATELGQLMFNSNLQSSYVH